MEFIRRNTDYALRALAFMGKRPQGDIHLVSEVARETDVPENFLRKISQKLYRAGILNSHRGPKGGFSLAKEPESVTVLEVMEALQGPVVVNRCFLSRETCPNFADCDLRRNLVGVQQSMLELFDEVTVARLATEISRGR